MRQSAIGLQPEARLARTLRAAHGFARVWNGHVTIGCDVLEKLEDGFEKSVAATPGAPALITPEGVLTYGELDARIRAAAACLVARGIQADQPVGILTDDVARVVAVLGVMRAGAVPLILDPDDAPSRHGLVLANAGARWAICHSISGTTAAFGIATHFGAPVEPEVWTT